MHLEVTGLYLGVGVACCLVCVVSDGFDVVIAGSCHASTCFVCLGYELRFFGVAGLVLGLCVFDWL